MEIPRILVVDDERDVRTILQRILERAGWQTDTAASGEEAIRKAAAIGYDLILLDLYMEPLPGLQVLEAIRRADPDIVGIILTAHGSMESAVEALRLGAFDYLFKPATPETIQSRVEAGLRFRRQMVRRRRLVAQVDALQQILADIDAEEASSPGREADSRFLRAGELLIDRAHRSVTIGGSAAELTSAEFDVLTCLMDAAPEPVAATELVRSALGYEAEESEARNIIKWHIHHLRSKIEPRPDRPLYVITVRYRGYQWGGRLESLDEKALGHGAIDAGAPDGVDAPAAGSVPGFGNPVPDTNHPQPSPTSKVQALCYAEDAVERGAPEQRPISSASGRFPGDGTPEPRRRSR
jgi:DNA-binding response OmpR family regulator